VPINQSAEVTVGSPARLHMHYLSHVYMHLIVGSAADCHDVYDVPCASHDAQERVKACRTAHAWASPTHRSVKTASVHGSPCAHVPGNDLACLSSRALRSRKIVAVSANVGRGQLRILSRRNPTDSQVVFIYAVVTRLIVSCLCECI